MGRRVGPGRALAMGSPGSTRTPSASHVGDEGVVFVRIRVSKYTRWGENVVLVGEGSRLGHWDPARAVRMVPHHVGDELIWQAYLDLVVGDDENGDEDEAGVRGGKLRSDSEMLRYTYALVDEDGRPLPGYTKERIMHTSNSSMRREVRIPRGLGPRAVMDVDDRWERSAEVEVFSRSAFSTAVFGRGQIGGSLARDRGGAAGGGAGGGGVEGDGMNHQHQWPVARVGQFSAQLRVVDMRLVSEHLEMRCVGNAKALGGWDREKSVRMRHSEGGVWDCCVNVGPGELPLEFLFLQVDTRTGETVFAESGPPRVMTEYTPAQPSSVSPAYKGGVTFQGQIVEGDEAAEGSGESAGDRLAGAMEELDLTAPPSTPTSSRQMPPDVRLLPASAGLTMCAPFRYPHPWRGAGLAVPVFSLRSRASVGCGDFLDLVMLADFAARAGYHLLQLLPVNDTSVFCDWRDSYPYRALSCFALHPLYLALGDLIEDVEDGRLRAELDAEVAKERESLEALDAVDYERTVNFKLGVARRCYDAGGRAKMLGEEARGGGAPPAAAGGSRADFEAFAEETGEWLRPYSLFCFLRDLFGGSDHFQWGAMQGLSESRLAELTDLRKSEISTTVGFYMYLQWRLDAQLRRASSHCARRGIALKGDLPIGVGLHSVDVWRDPALFKCHMSVGAPPDAFAEGGQNWGFPAYNWDAMRDADGYGWWRRRLSGMARHFHAFRIDHILGFFRIWEIPREHVSGALGRFCPSEPVTRGELEGLGLWDVERLCDPYVREENLMQLFGSGEGPAGTLTLVDYYFDKIRHQCYQFKPEFRSEKALVESLEDPHEVTRWGGGKLDAASTLAGLVALLHSVCLLRDPHNPDHFYPVYGMEGTDSFKELSSEWKEKLLALRHNFLGDRQENLWRSSAMEKLPMMMDATDMLVCGEDLGSIPQCCFGVMGELGLLSLKVQRMPGPGDADPTPEDVAEVPEDINKGEFGNPKGYPYMSVCSPSSHDTSTLRGWWEESHPRAERFARAMLRWPVDAPVPVRCTPECVHAVLESHVQSPSMWAVFPIQDVLALEARLVAGVDATAEQINRPEDPNHYWRYRMHICLEDLLADDVLCRISAGLIRGANRACNALLE